MCMVDLVRVKRDLLQYVKNVRTVRGMGRTIILYFVKLGWVHELKGEKKQMELGRLGVRNRANTSIEKDMLGVLRVEWDEDRSVKQVWD